MQLTPFFKLRGKIGFDEFGNDLRFIDMKFDDQGEELENKKACQSITSKDIGLLLPTSPTVSMHHLLLLLSFYTLDIEFDYYQWNESNIPGKRRAHTVWWLETKVS